MDEEDRDPFVPCPFDWLRSTYMARILVVTRGLPITNVELFVRRSSILVRPIVMDIMVKCRVEERALELYYTVQRQIVQDDKETRDDFNKHLMFLSCVIPGMNTILERADKNVPFSVRTIGAVIADVNLYNRIHNLQPQYPCLLEPDHQGPSFFVMTRLVDQDDVQLLPIAKMQEAIKSLATFHVASFLYFATHDANNLIEFYQPGQSFVDGANRKELLAKRKLLKVLSSALPTWEEEGLHFGQNAIEGCRFLLDTFWEAIGNVVKPFDDAKTLCLMKPNLKSCWFTDGNNEPDESCSFDGYQDIQLSNAIFDLQQLVTLCSKQFGTLHFADDMDLVANMYLETYSQTYSDCWRLTDGLPELPFGKEEDALKDYVLTDLQHFNWVACLSKVYLNFVSRAERQPELEANSPVSLNSWARESMAKSSVPTNFSKRKFRQVANKIMLERNDRWASDAFNDMRDLFHDWKDLGLAILERHLGE